MSISRMRQLKALLFFCAPAEDNDEHDCVSEAERKVIEEKIAALRVKFDAMKRYLQTLNMPYLFFVSDELLIDSMNDAFDEIENKDDCEVYDHFLNNMLKAMCDYQALIEKAQDITNTRKQLKEPQLTPEKQIQLAAQLTAQQATLKSHYDQCVDTSTKLNESTLQLAGKSSAFKLATGIGLSVTGALVIGAAILLFVFVAVVPLAVLIAIAAVGVTAIIAGAVLIANGRQQGFSKETYDASRNTENQAKTLVTSMLR